MSGEQKTFEDSVKEYMIKQGVHDRPDITEHDFRQGWIACEREQSAALKAALAELIPIAELAFGEIPEECVLGYGEVKFCNIRNGDGNRCKHCLDKNAIRRAHALLNKQPQSESDKTE